MISNIVTCMLLINDELIVGTNKGLQQFKITDRIEPGHQIGKAEGLPGNEIKYLDYFNDENVKLWGEHFPTPDFDIEE